MEHGNEFDPERQTKRLDPIKKIDTTNVNGKNVLITGGANGIGAEFTRRLCKEG